MTRRYSTQEVDYECWVMREDREGEWVKWEDCVALLKDKIADLQYLKGYIDGELDYEIVRAQLNLEDSERGSYS